jgi:cellobiose phosphorylase
VTRRFRGASYEINVTNARGAQISTTKIVVDGRPIDGNLVPVAPAGSTVRIEVSAR